MVLPRMDILLGGAIQDERKLVGARIVRNFMERLEKAPSASTPRIALPKGLMPAWIGSAVIPGDHKGQPWELPLGGMLHCLVSGRTGSGKSCLGRVLVEGLVVYEDLAILILDPRGQWAGLLWPEDRSEVLARYGSFGLEPGQARSFPFTYHGVGLNLGEPLPEDLKQLALGRRIVSFKGMDDRARCELFARILEEAFEANATAESGRPGLLVVVEEITLFLKKGVMDEAQEAAQHAELSVDRIAREGRKYGVNLLLPGQSSKDLSYAMASTRQNITTRVFMGNSDREIEYADEFLSRMIVSLPPGEAFVCNPEWGVVRIRVRPSLSKVHEPGEQEIRRVVGLPDPGRPPTAIRCRAGGA